MTGDTALREERIVRYTFSERLMHWFSGFTYLYLLMSGLALYAPQLYWMATILGGGPTARFWHPWVGLLFTIAMIWMHQTWREQMRITEVDRAWIRDVDKYIQNRDEEVPAADRFNAGQKYFYWVMGIGTIFLLLSGLVMWFPEYVPWSLRGLRYAAVITHELAALITIGAFIIHVYMGLFMVPGGFRGIVLGYVSPQWARTHHRLWFNRIWSNRDAVKE
jgi:formate dehydrogenase subunit gamma